MRPAVANVPTTPRAVIGTTARRKRAHPTLMPPSKRITIRASTAIRSTSLIESSPPRRGKTWAPIAAASRKIAGEGIGTCSLTRFASTARAKTAETTRTIRPKWVSSPIGSEPRAPGGGLDLGCEGALGGVGGQHRRVRGRLADRERHLGGPRERPCKARVAALERGQRPLVG